MEHNEDNRINDLFVTDGERKYYAYYTELLENQYIVESNPEIEGSKIHYHGTDEIEAYRVFKNLGYKYKRLFLANVQMMEWDYMEGVDNIPWIHHYEIIKRLA